MIERAQLAVRALELALRALAPRGQEADAERDTQENHELCEVLSIQAQIAEQQVVVRIHRRDRQNRGRQRGRESAHECGDDHGEEKGSVAVRLELLVKKDVDQQSSADSDERKGE